MLNYDFQVVSTLYYGSLEFSFQIRNFKHPFLTGDHEVISFLKDVHRKQGSSFLMHPLCIDFIYIKCASWVFVNSVQPSYFFFKFWKQMYKIWQLKIQTHWACKVMLYRFIDLVCRRKDWLKKKKSVNGFEETT